MKHLNLKITPFGLKDLRMFHRKPVRGFFILRANKMEIWKGINGFEGVYQISSHGRMKSFKRTKCGYVLSNKNQTGGYLSVVLRIDKNNYRYVRIHVLVAEAFLPIQEGKNHINHKDFDKQNNRVENLEWVTPAENYAHQRKHGRANFKGMNHYNRVTRPLPVYQISLIDKQVIAVFTNCVDAAKSTGVCSRNINQVAAKTEYKPGLTRKQAGGFGWRF